MAPRHARVRPRARLRDRAASALARRESIPVLVAILLAAVAVPVVAAGRADGPVAASAPTAVSVTRPSAPVPAPSDPLVPPPGVDWQVDAQIRAAVLAQQEQDRVVRAARRQAERKAARYVPPATTPSTPPTAASDDVWVVGDSIAEGMGAAWPGTPYVLADPGQRSATVVPQVLSALAAGGPRVLVVALGTNDSSLDVAGFRARVHQILDAAPGCVVWTTIHRPGGAWEPFNDVLRSIAAEGRLRIADWDAYADAHPDTLQSDGIHPRTGTVYAAIAGLAASAAQGC